MASPKRVKFTLSKDGKTITAGGKTYSLSAFKSQFTITAGGLGDGIGSSGFAEPKTSAKAPVKINTNPKPSVGKTRIGGLGAGRAVGMGGGMNWQTK